MGHDHPDHEHDHDHPHRHPEPDHAGPSVADDHRHHAPAQVATFVITCSDTRTPESDAGGALLRSLLEQAGHSVAGALVIRDEVGAIRPALDRALASGARAIFLTGGTGISRRDVTLEALEGLLEKRLPGFGELFRMLSFQEIGSAAMLSRAAAGTWQGALIFALPGSPQALRLALQRLILPELGHAVRELTR